MTLSQFCIARACAQLRETAETRLLSSPEKLNLKTLNQAVERYEAEENLQTEIPADNLTWPIAGNIQSKPSKSHRPGRPVRTKKELEAEIRELRSAERGRLAIDRERRYERDLIARAERRRTELQWERSRIEDAEQVAARSDRRTP